MYYWIYNIGLCLALPVIIGLLLIKKRLQRGVGPRLGMVPSDLRNLPKPVIWLHAASLGEVVAVVPLLRSVKQSIPQSTLVVSTVTETGKEVVLSRLSGIAQHCYSPLDFPWAVKRYVRVLAPSAFILMEAELWPNLLRCLHTHRIPICLINGRISSRSFSRYRYVSGMIRQMLGYLSLALMQTPRDADRIRQLGAEPAIVHVTGNMKFDQNMVDPMNGTAVTLSRKHIGLSDHETLWVAGSTHPQEEECLLEAYAMVREMYPHLVLMLAPRHIERVGKLEQVVADFGLSCIRRSAVNVSDDPVEARQGGRVVILDTRGELAHMYRFGQVAFVGGTLVPIGGHNLLEPAQWGIPVLFGPYIDHCQDIASLLLAGGGGLQVKNSGELARQVSSLLEDTEKAKEVGAKAKAVVQQHRGVVQKNLRIILELLSTQSIV